MKNKEKKTFDTVAYFRAIKEKLAEKMSGMTLSQQKDFMEKVRKGEINIT